MSFEIICDSTLGNTGDPTCNPNKGVLIKHILCPKGTEFATESAAQDIANWIPLINGLASTRVRPLPEYDSYTSEKDDSRSVDRDNGKRTYIGEGYEWGSMAMWDYLPYCTQANLKSLNGNDWCAFGVYSNDFIEGYSEDGIKFQPLPLKYYFAGEKIGNNDETHQSTAHVFYTNPELRTSKGQLVKVDFIDELVGLTDVTVTIVGTPTGDEVVIDIKDACSGDGIPDLVVADFYLNDDAGGDEPLTSATESTSVQGRYTLVPTTTITTDTYLVGLNVPSVMTTKGYEMVAAATFDIA